MANKPNTFQLQWWNPFSWFEHGATAATNWLGSIGGSIASGLEGGFIAIFKDMWMVVLPWAEIVLGFFIIMWALMIFFRSDIMKGAALIAKVAA